MIGEEAKKEDGYQIIRLFKVLTDTFDIINEKLQDEGCNKCVIEWLDEVESDMFIRIDNEVYNEGGVNG